MSGLLANRAAETVLIVDDDAVSREVLATVFTMSGYTVVTAASGEEAVATLDAGAPALRVILVDLRMEGLSGTELIAQLRARTQAAIVTMSASEPQAEAIAGTDGFLRKPFAPEELADVLARRAAQAMPAAETPDAAVLDRKILAQLRASMPETSVRALYAAALADLRERLSALEAAIGRNDTERVRVIGHAIKGGCGMIGACEAANLGALLETDCDRIENNRAVILRLRPAVEHLKCMLDAEFHAAQSGSKSGSSL